jgi:hypothetical protein
VSQDFLNVFRLHVQFMEQRSKTAPMLFPAENLFADVRPKFLEDVIQHS